MTIVLTTDPAGTDVASTLALKTIHVVKVLSVL